jgi:hypothetical protein
MKRRAKYLKVKQVDWMEHLNPHTSGAKRFLKRQSNRAMRRVAKADPENAPTKPRYRGWSF